MARKVDSEQVLSDWLERDLTAAVESGELPGAFEVDETVQQLFEIVASGRHPVVSGEPGVGKTAVLQELVRRAHAGSGPEVLRGRRFLQFSLRARASALTKAEQLRPEMQKLVAALIDRADGVVPIFRDLHLAYSYDLEPQFQLLALRFGGPILAEGERRLLDAMFEHTPELEQHYVPLPLSEPDLGVTERILKAWAAERARAGMRFEEAALLAALELSHRFLSRSHQPRKTIELLQQVGSVVGRERLVTEADVIERFHRSFKVPQLLIDPGVSFDPVATEREFRSQVLEQNEAVETVVRMISLIKAGLSDSRRPFGAFLFVGPTGVGKTHVAQLLAEYLFGSRERLIRLNMADHQDEHADEVLFGKPNAYSTSERRGLLSTRLLGHPFAVLLLDEFEKAHEKVHDRFLQLIDEGSFINGAGETLNCRSTIIIATSNAGAEVYRGQPIGFSGERDLASLDHELDRLLYKRFRLEFLNRFDQIVHFHPLTRQGIRAIALREIDALRLRSGIRSRGLTLEVDDTVLDWLTAHGYDPQFGARFLRRTIERHVTTAIAELLVQDAVPAGARLDLTVRGGRITARVGAQEPPADRQAELIRLPEGTAHKIKSLSRTELLAEIDALLARAHPKLQLLQQHQARARDLLTVMSQPDFWNDHSESQRVLEVYRELDVAVQLETRLAQPLNGLLELRQWAADQPEKPLPLGRALQAAAEALRDWEDRLAEQGASAVWLLLRNVDPLHRADDLIEQLVEMELSWCRRLHLAAELVAYGESDGALTRAVLEVEGPGAATYLAMEQGVHRMFRPNRPDLRIMIETVPRGPAPADALSRAVATLRRRSGRFGLEVSCAGRLEKTSGHLLELCANDPRTLAHLLSDLERWEPSEISTLPAARHYAQSGAGARDPRTGAVVARFRDVLAGKLDPLLEAWRHRSIETAVAAPGP